jgi:hypothetical protein
MIFEDLAIFSTPSLFVQASKWGRRDAVRTRV